MFGYKDFTLKKQNVIDWTKFSLGFEVYVTDKICLSLESFLVRAPPIQVIYVFISDTK